MNVVKESHTVKLKVAKNELLEGKYLNFQLLSQKLGIAEKEANLSYKSFRNKFYNSRACGKYNMKNIAGLPCIDVKEPMKGFASLILEFEVEG